jgi:glutamate---cysteine ligase / carboxylate-amine ligase
MGRSISTMTDVSPARGAETDERALRKTFDRIAPFTIGIEEEYLLVDSETQDLLPAATRALARLDGDRRIAPELRTAQIEGITPVCATVAQVERELTSIRRLIDGGLDGSAVLVATGTHPLAPTPGEISPRSRYQGLAAANPWAASHVLTCGLHIHVAVGGADRALAVYNALRGYLPEITALAANAPIYHGMDSGLATVRPKLNQAWPRAGVPPAFASWAEVAEFARWARVGGAMPDESHQWWDMRLHPVHGTIEIRSADVQTHVEDSATVAAFVQALVFELASRYDAGEPLAVAAGERIAENAWLATRDGVNGWLIDLETGARMPTGERLHVLTERLLPSAAELGCDRELLGIGRIVLRGGGAGWQRQVFDAFGAGTLILGLASESLPPGCQAGPVRADDEPALETTERSGAGSNSLQRGPWAMEADLFQRASN